MPRPNSIPGDGAIDDADAGAKQTVTVEFEVVENRGGAETPPRADVGTDPRTIPPGMERDVWVTGS